MRFYGAAQHVGFGVAAMPAARKCARHLGPGSFVTDEPDAPIRIDLFGLGLADVVQEGRALEQG